MPELDEANSKGEIDLGRGAERGRILGSRTRITATTSAFWRRGAGLNMGDGWETRRRREPGYDWMIIALGARGTVEKALIDTAHFKGNYPDSASIQAADLRSFGDGLTDALITDSMFWKELFALAETGPGCRAQLPRRTGDLGAGDACALQHLPRWRGFPGCGCTGPRRHDGGSSEDSPKHAI